VNTVARDGGAPAVQTRDHCQRIVQALAEVGWSVTDDFLPPHLVETLRREAMDLRHGGGFHRAGVGRGGALQVRADVRGDEIFWLDPGRCSPAQLDYLGRIEALRQAINQALYLGLFELEAHLAVYPPGAFYQRHLDHFRGVEARTVSCICYLNDVWCEADGGQLRLYADPMDPQVGTDIWPLGGRLVTFLSGDLAHEVLPARRERVSLTGWLKRRSAGP
jgi:SM-20-related protein